MTASGIIHRRPLSAAAHERASRVIPGGVNSPARAFRAVGGNPLFIASAEGAYLHDLDGGRYLDCIQSWGPMILGHGHPKVVAAVQEALFAGSSYGAPCERETELAEMIVAAIPSIDRVRFTSSGTEAVMSAVRLARGYTGRDLIVKFSGCYHGHVDSLLVSAGSGALTNGVPDSPGVPLGCTRDTIVLPFNDTAALAEAFVEYGPRIAAVITEAVVGNSGLILPTPEFRGELRSLTLRHGALLIYDEVMTGFRLAYGGFQNLHDEMPDITTLGKIIGGGFPVGAYGGREEIMNFVSPVGPVYQAGTLSGNPVAMSAGIATLKELRDHPPYQKLDQLGALLAEGLTSAAKECRIPHTLNRIGSMWTLFFTEGPVHDLVTAMKSDRGRYAKFFWKMIDRGYYLPCSPYESAFLSAAMTEEEIRTMVAAASEVFREMSRR